MEEQLFWIAELEVVGGIEREKHSGFEVAGLVLEVLHVGGEHVGQVLHYHWDVLKSLVLGLRVHDRKNVVEGWVDLEVVEARQWMDGLLRSDDRDCWSFWGCFFVVIIDHPR